MKTITESEDMLSSLPDNLLIEILTLLPINTAVTASLLSKRWLNLWTHLNHLKFSRFELKNNNFYTTVNHILPQLTSHKITTFYLSLPDPPHGSWVSCCGSVQSWVTWVCSRNVETFELDISRCEGLICLPTCVFECRSLAVLKLSDGFDYKLPDSGIIRLPNLKKLRISLEDSHKQLMGTLFKSCPLLEDLHLKVRVKESDHYVVYVSSANLKYLTIFAYENDRAKGVGIKFMIDALSLRKFVLLGERSVQ